MNAKALIPLILGNLLLAGLLAFLHAAPLPVRAAGGAWFAAPGGAGDCSQAAPCTLAAALATAAPGDRIYLSHGTYAGSGPAVVSLAKSVSLYGGWDGAATGPILRDPAAYTTTLDGQGQRRVIFVGSGLAVTLDGLHIVNGVDTLWGAGLYAHGVELTIRDTEFYSNAVDAYDTANRYAYGGGAFVEEGLLEIEGTTFRGNSSQAVESGYGGGLAISHTLAVTVSNCTFFENDAWHASGLYFLGDGGAGSLLLRASYFEKNGKGNSFGPVRGGYGGAIEITQAQAQIVGNSFINNDTANEGGAIEARYSSLTLARNVITGNRSYEAGAIFFMGCSSLAVTNNVIANNQTGSARSAAVVFLSSAAQASHNTIAANPGAYGIYVFSYSTAAFTNTILAGHTLGISVTAPIVVSLEGTLWGAGEWANATDWGGSGTILTGTVNVWGDPAFLNPAAGNFHLTAGSAAIDAGVDAASDTDIDGDPRPLPAGAAPDLGADEFDPLDVPPAVQSITRLDPNPTGAAAVRYRVAFSEIVSGVDAADFALHSADTLGGAAVSSISGSGAVYTVTVSTGTGSGQLRLDVPTTASVTDQIGFPLTGLPYTAGETYFVKRAAPSASIYLPLVRKASP
ncbi:MAG: right-handed parallel beta-helix repeat-containing protein [Chloroflexota bacterium]